MSNKFLLLSAKMAALAGPWSYFGWTIILALLHVQGSSTEPEDFYDPWKESDRPKVVVDYNTGPLRGKTTPPVVH